MKLKVCGITELEQMQRLEALGVDFAGLIFYEKSKRFVGDKLESRLAEVKAVPIKKVGVFVNADIDEIMQAVSNYGLSYVQLHGDETPEFCRELKKNVSVIKAIRINADTDLKNLLQSYSEAVDYFLFDTDSKEYGGTGKKFNWELLQNLSLSKPFFLSGGIALEDVEELKKINHPQLFAVDVNSRFETTPGVKDLDKVELFLNRIK